jgi:hypothetical protein
MFPKLACPQVRSGDLRVGYNLLTGSYVLVPKEELEGPYEQQISHLQVFRPQRLLEMKRTRRCLPDSKI